MSYRGPSAVVLAVEAVDSPAWSPALGVLTGLPDAEPGTDPSRQGHEGTHGGGERTDVNGEVGNEAAPLLCEGVDDEWGERECGSDVGEGRLVGWLWGLLVAVHAFTVPRSGLGATRWRSHFSRPQ